MSDETAPRLLPRHDGATIAYRAVSGKSPGVVFCGGYKSDMTGTKATALEAHCRSHGRAFIRFDYFGHGESSGRFEDGTIGRWAEDAIAVIDSVARGPQVLVGSSMGGWIMLLAARARPDRVKGLLGIAPAPDFTTELIPKRWSPERLAELKQKRVLYLPSQYGAEPYAYTWRLIEDGERHLVMQQPISFAGPSRLLHGMADPDVPWQHSLRLVDALAASDVAVTFIKDGDHRLSREQDIVRLLATLDEVCARVPG
jgi:pimeloyl-ACP methyl ester carboxylesterase